MLGRPLACLLTTIGLLVAPALPVRAAGPWSRIRSEHFLFVSEAPEGRVRDLAAELEQFREVVSRALPPAALDSPLPTVILVFRSDRSFTPYKPLFEGRPIVVNGFFQGGDDVNYMAVNVEFERSTLRTVFHEFAHLLTRNMEGEMPVWVSEGLAGVYETFEVRRDGKGATFGLLNTDRLNLLRQETMMPLRDLLAVEHSSAEYNEGDRRRVFYAQSWAAMHYLMFGNEKRAGQLRGYLDRLRDDAEPEEAFRAAFGNNVEGLEKEMREYSRRLSFPDRQVTFSEKVQRVSAGRAEPIDDAEAGAYLGDLLARMDRPGEARALLRPLIERFPSSGSAASVLGRIELAADDTAAAYPLLERAVTLAPGDEGNRLRLADVLIRREEFARATEYLEPLARDARLPDTRQRAQDLLDYATSRVEDLRAEALAAASPVREIPLAGDSPPTDAAFVAGGTAVGSPGSRFRPVGPGEMRVLGTLIAVECRGQSAVLVIATDDQSVYLETAGLADVQFIAYQDPTPASPVCGPVGTPARVFATYRDVDTMRAGDNVDGRVVAIEWLPDDFAPR